MEWLLTYQKWLYAKRDGYTAKKPSKELVYRAGTDSPQGISPPEFLRFSCEKHILKMVFLHKRDACEQCKAFWFTKKKIFWSASKTSIFYREYNTQISIFALWFYIDFLLVIFWLTI
jgi:hypothetical protein